MRIIAKDNRLAMYLRGIEGMSAGRYGPDHEVNKLYTESAAGLAVATHNAVTFAWGRSYPQASKLAARGRN